MKLCGKILLLVALLLAFPTQAPAATIREPAWAGGFYPARKDALSANIESYVARAANTHLDLPKGGRLRALVMPHAGYIYSGWTAAHVGRVLKKGEFRKVIVLGPDHRVGFRNGAISTADYFRTPLGLIKLHPDAATLLRRHDIFHYVPASDRAEHSIEVELPFLQYFLGDFELVPVVLGPSDTIAIAGVLEPLVDDRTLLVVSTDLSHYLSYKEAVARDRQTIWQLLALDEKGLAAGENRACGREGLLVLLELARARNWRPLLLHYSNSGDTADDRQRVVGYGALAFYQGDEKTAMEEAKNIDAKEGQYLVRLARQSIREHLGQKIDSENAATLTRVLTAPKFQEKRGVFVTLHKHGQLRGCIGSLLGFRSIVDGVRENAVNAAFNDYRFHPVTGTELAELDIEVSILSQPRRLDYDSAEDLLAKLRPGVDGVIIRHGGASATFLPQVWDQLPEPADFLNHLCQKAGLAPQIWRQGGLEVQTYQVRYFAEEK